MLFTIICNEREKYFRIANEDNFDVCVKLCVSEKIIGQFNGEEDKEQAHQMIWKLRPDLEWRP